LHHQTTTNNIVQILNQKKMAAQEITTDAYAQQIEALTERVDNKQKEVEALRNELQEAYTANVRLGTEISISKSKALQTEEYLRNTHWILSELISKNTETIDIADLQPLSDYLNKIIDVMDEMP